MAFAIDPSVATFFQDGLFGPVVVLAGLAIVAGLVHQFGDKLWK